MLIKNQADLDAFKKMYGIDADFSDVDQFFEDGKREVVAGMKEEGEAFVEDAKATGNYQDHTKHLRESNDYDLETGEELNYSLSLDALRNTFIVR